MNAIRVLNRDLQVDMSHRGVAREGSSYIPAPEKDSDGRHIAQASQTIQGSPEQLYALWSDVSLSPKWQEYVISVTPIAPRLTHWIMGNPEDQDGKRLEFDSQIVEEIPGKKIAWRSVDEVIDLIGSVTFADAASGRGTLVTLTQSFKEPLGAFGSAVAAVAKRSPKQIVIENLRHFKQLVETGEIPSVKGQPHGPRGLSGGLKEWIYGETNPTPPGTSDAA